MPDATRTFRTEWSTEDAEYVGTCDEYPSLSWLEPNEPDAMNGILQLVATIDAEAGSQ